MLEETAALFRRHFGAPPEAAARAPARVNWIGEHTDYNEGLVLPSAVDRFAVVVVRPRDDGCVAAVSREAGPSAPQPLRSLRRLGAWSDYVHGSVAALAAAGHRVEGVSVAIASDVPLGAGLSSSAALTVGTVTAVDALLGLGLAPRARARIAHAAETDFVGVPCGILDPFASALARAGGALRIDCRSEAVTHVPVPADARLLVMHSGVARQLVDGRYANRRAECAAALAAARAAGIAPPHAQALRALDPDALPALARSLSPMLMRRTRHVIAENLRVDAVCAAFAAGDLVAAGASLQAGHASLRDDFEVSVPELDTLCALADDAPGCLGSRLVGAGFGGCTLHLVAPDAAASVADAVCRGFEASYGRRPPSWVLIPAAGATALAL